MTMTLCKRSFAFIVFGPSGIWFITFHPKQALKRFFFLNPLRALTCVNLRRKKMETKKKKNSDDVKISGSSWGKRHLQTRSLID